MALFLFLYGVLGSVFAVLGCASMLVSVTFYVGMRDDWCVAGSCGWKAVWKKEEDIALARLLL